MSIRIDGKQISAQIKDELKERVEKENLEVTLAVIQVGNDPASTVYVGNKKKACEYIGIRSGLRIAGRNTGRRTFAIDQRVK